MKPVTGQKLYAFFALIISIFIFISISSCQKDTSADATKTSEVSKANTSASSGIIYTDINPDIPVKCSLNCSHAYQLDLNKDGKNDFNITILTSGFLLHKFITISITTNNNSAVAIDSLPLALNSGISIASSLNWGTGGTLYSYSSSSSCTECPVKIVRHGNWDTSNDRYAGLKISLNGNAYYGWIRLNIAITSSSFTVRDYAYNSIPNQPILAGQTK